MADTTSFLKDAIIERPHPHDPSQMLSLTITDVFDEHLIASAADGESFAVFFAPCPPTEEMTAALALAESGLYASTLTADDADGE
jgi:hypothetical protein